MPLLAGKQSELDLIVFGNFSCNDYMAVDIAIETWQNVPTSHFQTRSSINHWLKPTLAIHTFPKQKQKLKRKSMLPETLLQALIGSIHYQTFDQIEVYLDYSCLFWESYPWKLLYGSLSRVEMSVQCLKCLCIARPASETLSWESESN